MYGLRIRQQERWRVKMCSYFFTGNSFDTIVNSKQVCCSWRHFAAGLPTEVNNAITLAHTYTNLRRGSH